MAQPPELFTLVEGELYAWKRDRLGSVRRAEADSERWTDEVGRRKSDVLAGR